jgi:dihydroorotase
MLEAWIRAADAESWHVLDDEHLQARVPCTSERFLAAIIWPVSISPFEYKHE